MDLKKAFNQLTGNTDNTNGKIRGTTKSKVKKLAGDDWNEKAWHRMVWASNYKKYKSGGGALPFFDKSKKLWFWI